MCWGIYCASETTMMMMMMMKKGGGDGFDLLICTTAGSL